jgi:hypothetical protein
MTQHIDKMREGDTSMRITAIGGDIQYAGQGDFGLRLPEARAGFTAAGEVASVDKEL